MDLGFLLNSIASVIAGVVVAYLAVLGIIFVAKTALFVLQGIGLMEMSKALEIKRPWIAFIPVLSVFSLGRIAEKYEKKDGSKSKKLSVILLALRIAEIVLLISFFVAFIISVLIILTNANQALSQGIEMNIGMFKAIIPTAILYVCVLAVVLTYLILYFVSLWRVYNVFDSKNATLYTVLSVIMPFLVTIFIFIIRKKVPKLTYSERIGLNEA